MDNEFQTAFWAAKRAIALAAEAAYNRYGVRSGQQFVLRELWRSDGMTPGEIARALELATPTVTRTATRMEAAGLLRRQADERDARLVRLWLTDRGRELEEAIAVEMERLTDRALRTLTAEERDLCVKFLGEIRSNLS